MRHLDRLTHGELDRLLRVAIRFNGVTVDSLREEILDPQLRAEVSRNVESLSARLPLQSTERGFVFAVCLAALACHPAMSARLLLTVGRRTLEVARTGCRARPGGRVHTRECVRRDHVHVSQRNARGDAGPQGDYVGFGAGGESPHSDGPPFLGT